jgi:hypothetical protein
MDMREDKAVIDMLEKAVKSIGAAESLLRDGHRITFSPVVF